MVDPYYRDPSARWADPYFFASSEEKRGLRKAANGLCWLLLAIQGFTALLSVLPGVFLRLLGLQSFDNAFSGFPPVLYYLAHGATYVLGLSVPVFVYLLLKHIPLAQALPFGPVKPGTAAALVLFGTGICTLANIPANWVITLEQYFGFSGAIPDLPLSESAAVQALFFVALVIIPPLTEELIFRGAVLSVLRRYGDAFAIIGSAFLFAIYHGNFSQAVFAFPCGVVMAFAVVKSGSLWVSIFIHFLNNGAAVALELIQYRSGNSALFDYFFLVSVLLGFFAVIYLAVRDRSFFFLERPASLLSPSQKFGSLVWNVGGVLLILLSLFSAVYILWNY